MAAPHNRSGQSGWHTYSGFDPKYFTKVREVRSLTNQEQAKVAVDCQLALTCRCQVQDSDAAVLILRVTTSNTGDDNVKLRANIKVAFKHERDAGNAEESSVAVTGARKTPLRLTSCQPPAVKGLPQEKRKTVQTNIEPAVSVASILDFGLGSHTRGYEENTSTNWSFNTFCRSENEPSGYYNSVHLQLDAVNRRSLISFAKRPVTAAAVLENVGGLVVAQSEVKLHTSAWLPRLRCWGRNMISRPRENGSKSIRRDIVLGAQSSERIQSSDKLESLLRSYVEVANEQSLPLEMEDSYSTTLNSASGNMVSNIVSDPDNLDDIAINAAPTMTTSACITSTEHTLARVQAIGMSEGNVQAWQNLFLTTLVSLLSWCEW